MCPIIWSQVVWRADSLEKTLMLGKWSESHSIVFNSLQPYGLYRPWNSPGQNTGVVSCSLLQGIFTSQGSNPGYPHCRRILYPLSPQRSLMLGKIEDKRRELQRLRWLDNITTQWTWTWANSGRSWRTGKSCVLKSMGSQRVEHDLTTTLDVSRLSIWYVYLKSFKFLEEGQAHNENSKILLE